MPGRHGSPEERFFRHIRKTPTCWLWTAARSVDGYGWFSLSRRRHTAAHRFAYRLLVGQIPADRQLDHLCRVRACVNPAHLELVTQAENNRRSDSPSAVNARKIACDNGHPFDAANTYPLPKGGRDCRMCRREASRRYYARRVHPQPISA